MQEMEAVFALTLLRFRSGWWGYADADVFSLNLHPTVVTHEIYCEIAIQEDALISVLRRSAFVSSCLCGALAQVDKRLRTDNNPGNAFAIALTKIAFVFSIYAF
jgi:hypothetical protein